PREDPADQHGEFAVRGGIVDIFPAGEAHPVRLEFIGDTIESLRTYDPSNQRSIAAVDQIAVVPLRDVLNDDRRATVFDYFTRARSSRIIVSEHDEVEAAARKVLEQIERSYQQATGASPEANGDVTAEEWEELGADADDGDLIVERAELKAALSKVEGRRRTAARSRPTIAATPGRAERTLELLKDYDVFAIPVERAEDARYAALLVAVGRLSRGFRLPDAQLQIYAETDVFEEERRAPERRRSATQAFLSDLRDLKVGDYVVHVDHGIGAFVGLKQIGIADNVQEFLELRYAGEDKLFVPVERLDLVQKYTGATRPPIDRLGGTSWERAKTKVKKAMRDMAEDLLKLYAARKAVAGHAF